MRILLVALNAKWIHPSLALRLLKANLGEYEGDAEIMEFALRQRLVEKTGPVLAARPEILGISVSIWNHRQTLELLAALEEAWGRGVPKPVVVLGGPEVSFLPEGAELFRHADWVIRGEGERAFRELCGRLLRGGSCGAGEEPRPADGPRFIDAAPLPLEDIRSAYHYYREEDLRRKLVYVEASRGCPYSCEFCLSPAERRLSGGGTAPREFPLEPFLAEMDSLIRRGARNFKFLDRTFNFHPRRARAIMEFFLERILAERERLCVHFEMVPSRFPEEIREIIPRFPPGSLRLEIGVQTFNPETAARIRRPLDEATTGRTLEFLARNTHAILHVDLIAGLPGESLAGFGVGFDRLWQFLDPGSGSSVEIQIGILKLLPGAAIARHSDACGMKYAPDPPYEALETAAMPREDLDRLKNFARFWELVMNRRKFPAFAAAFCPPGIPQRTVFWRFLALADGLLARFGRNWGIDRRDLEAALAAALAGEPAGET
ncbi:MAG: B12-binding domain-containing radical SAM protein [Treponema sp.]|nr:B12-binding domain-containing radical SAM protein [Treponema sp.]